MSKNLKDQISTLVKKFEARQFEEVINKSIVILKKNDNDFLWNLLGLSFQNIGQLNKSIDCFENSLNLNPKNFTSLNNLGLSQKKLKNYFKAEEYLLKALEINSQYINALVNLGNVKNETYFFDKAIFYYQEALKLNKNIPLIYLNISKVYQTINKIEDAKKYLNIAISIDQTFTMADQKLTKLGKYNTKSSHLKKMLDKLDSPELSENQKVYLYFGLHKVFKDIGDYKKSLNYLISANKLQRKLLKYDINFHKSLSKKIKNIFTNIDFKKYEQVDKGENYIFILGMPRSGTTLIEQIISAHSEVSSISESNFIPERIYKNINLDEENIKNFLNSDFEKEYSNFIKSFNTDKKIIIDKTLTNFWYLGFIKIFFPRSKIIHISRNPKDNCLSIFENMFDQAEGWNSDQEELSEYYLIYKDLMKYWNEQFKGSILNIKYEDVVNDSEKKIKEIITYCNLDWEIGCLKFYNKNNPIKTVSVNQANKPIYNSSINKYEIYKKDLNILFSKLD